MNREQLDQGVATGIRLGTELDKKGGQKPFDTLFFTISKVAIEICKGSQVCIDSSLDVINN